MINITRLNEAHYVGVNDIASQILWTRYFMEEQGFNFK
jgi:hypothetical protein